MDHLHICQKYLEYHEPSCSETYSNMLSQLYTMHFSIFWLLVIDYILNSVLGMLLVLLVMFIQE
jgi:hypothetical protein